MTGEKTLHVLYVIEAKTNSVTEVLGFEKVAIQR